MPVEIAALLTAAVAAAVGTLVLGHRRRATLAAAGQPVVPVPRRSLVRRVASSPWVVAAIVFGVLAGLVLSDRTVLIAALVGALVVGGQTWDREQERARRHHARGHLAAFIATIVGVGLCAFLGAAVITQALS